MYKYKTMNDVIERLPRFMDELHNRGRLPSTLGDYTPGNMN
jgi:hypothetical protein